VLLVVGREYDKNGVLKSWWADDVITRFNETAQCFVEQYSKYTSNGEHVSTAGLFSPAQQQHCGLYVLLLLFYFFIFNDCCQVTNYLKIYLTSLHQICRVGRTMAVDERYEISFSMAQGTLPWQPSFCWFSGDIR